MMLLGIIFQVTLRVIPLKVVNVGISISNVEDDNWKETFDRFVNEHDGLFCLYDATAGNFVFETRDVGQRAGTPDIFLDLPLG